MNLKLFDMLLSYTIHVKFYINLKLCDMFFFNPQD